MHVASHRWNRWKHLQRAEYPTLARGNRGHDRTDYLHLTRLSPSARFVFVASTTQTCVPHPPPLRDAAPHATARPVVTKEQLAADGNLRIYVFSTMCTKEASFNYSATMVHRSGGGNNRQLRCSTFYRLVAPVEMCTAETRLPIYRVGISSDTSDANSDGVSYKLIAAGLGAQPTLSCDVVDHFWSSEGR